MSIITSALSAFGLGQNDIKHVTQETLNRCDKRDIQVPGERKGIVVGLTEMLNVLRAEDVITAATHKELFKKIEKWQGKGK